LFLPAYLLTKKFQPLETPRPDASSHWKTIVAEVPDVGKLRTAPFQSLEKRARTMP
jgi:hypothetical protein